MPSSPHATDGTTYKRDGKKRSTKNGGVFLRGEGGQRGGGGTKQRVDSWRHHIRPVYKREMRRKESGYIDPNRDVHLKHRSFTKIKSASEEPVNWEPEQQPAQHGEFVRVNISPKYNYTGFQLSFLNQCAFPMCCKNLKKSQEREIYRRNVGASLRRTAATVCFEEWNQTH